MSNSNEKKKKAFQWRSLASFILSITFIVLLVTGIVLYIAPRGRTANWTNWMFGGLDKEQWAAVHINLSLLFVLFGVVHIVLNWRPLWAYIKKKSGGLNRVPEMAVAIVLSLFFIVGSIVLLPPFSNVMDVNMAMKDYWERNAAVAPYPHAEESPLDDFCFRTGLAIKEAKTLLESKGYTAEDSMTIGDIAKSKGVPPSELFADLQERFPRLMQMGRGAGKGAGQGMGVGARQSGEEGEHVPGQGMGPGGGQGMGPGGGQGMGRGMGRGMGPGGGQGMGRGMGMGPGGEHADEEEHAGGE